jgi:hypothetical protein
MPAPRLPLLVLALAAVAAGMILLWRHAAPAPAAALRAGSAPLAARISPPAARPPSATPAAAAARAQPAFAPIHGQLRRLLEVQTGDEETRDRLLQELAAELTDENVAAVLRTLSREELRTAFGAQALERWLQLDPAAAADWIGGRTDASPRDAALVAGALLPNAAALNAYCDQLPDGTFKEAVLTDAGLQILPRDPAEAMALARRLGPGPGQTNLLETLAYDWTTRDPTAALNWMMGVHDPALRESLVAMGAKAVAVSDPSLAANWLAAGVQSPEVYRSTALALAETWVDRSPAEAAAWVAQLAPGAARQGAVDVILRHWLATDPDAARRWIAGLPERDGILQALQVAQTQGPAPPSDP